VSSGKSPTGRDFAVALAEFWKFVNYDEMVTEAKRAPVSDIAFPRKETPMPPEMTLRDWFAGLAMSGELASRDPEVWLCEDGLAKRAYTYADAMLAARLAKEPSKDGP
jgi:hypothetical protein